MQNDSKRLLGFLIDSGLTL